MADGLNNPEDSARALWESELKRVNCALQLVNEANKSLHRVEDVVSWLSQICQTAVDMGSYRAASVGFAEQDEEKSVRIVARNGFAQGYFNELKITWADEPHGRGPGGTAIRTGQTQIARNIPDDPNFLPWKQLARKYGFESAISLPLKSDHHTFGILSLYAPVANAFSKKEVDVLEELSADLAFGLTIVLRTRAERRAANEALKISERNLAEAQRVAHVGHWERDLKTNVMSCSEEVFRILGLDPQRREMHWSEFIQLVHPDDRPRINEVAANTVRPGCYDEDFRIILADGEMRFVHCHARLLRDDAGKAVRAFVVIQDVTERHEAAAALASANKALEAKNTALREVLASIESQQRKIGRQVTENVEKVVLPMVNSLKPGLSSHQQHHVEQLQDALEQLTSPFINDLARAAASLSPTELRIADLVRRGLAVKEIARLEHLSVQTIAAHRRNIRRKLGISNQKVNLATYLRGVLEKK
jgi:PAS domain S-box-containing protein